MIEPRALEGQPDPAGDTLGGVHPRTSSDARGAPWETVTHSPPTFALFWTTGPDTALDGVFRLLAMRLDADGRWEVFDRTCDPFPRKSSGSDPSRGSATARMAREFGVHRGDLSEAVPLEDAWTEFCAFLADSPLVVPDAASFVDWCEHLCGAHGVVGEGPGPHVIGLDELSALLFPGRTAARGGLVTTLLRDPHTGPPEALHPPQVHAALGQLVARFLALPAEARGLVAEGYRQTCGYLRATDPQAASRLGLALALVEYPSRWARSTGELFQLDELDDGGLSGASSSTDWGATLEALGPRAAEVSADLAEVEILPPDPATPAPFDEDDEALIDDIFRVHLPAVLAQDLGGAPEQYYRDSQHAVAREVAHTLGRNELLAVHAPTGTGKTIAYLVPALLWAHRYGVRLGVATYTRALQEQAMELEVPRTLAALARAGRREGLRVCLLKGRENYLCFRALRLAAPTTEEDAETWLAATRLALFALTDPNGDLDAFPLRAPLRLVDPDRHRTALLRLSRSVRARSGCCTSQADRDTCAAEIARRRAERSHVVITNQSFVLSRQEFFKHLIFDECEHLHEQAHNAFSHTLSFATLTELLKRIHRPGGGPARTPLDRLVRQVVPASLAGDELTGALEHWSEARTQLRLLEEEVRTFDAWRQDERRLRDDRDEHSLFREYLDLPEGAALITARDCAASSLNGLDTALCRVAETIDSAPVRGVRRIRRGLDLARADLSAVLLDLEAWIPLKDGKPDLHRQTFYDVERDTQGGYVMAARVLLPNEYLGRYYYPGLSSAVFLSATTKLQGSFESSLGYLGLDRARDPAPDEEREGREVRTFSGPEVFDYGRVLIGVPRDAPPPADKDRHLEYVTSFLAWLGERTRGRMLVLFTNLSDVRRVATALAPRLESHHIPLWYQGMPAAGKEELAELFRTRVDSVLLGVDTFWYGADFPGETLEYLVIVRLPYGVPDRYHHAQCAALGTSEQRKRIYLPRALAKFRQGFGRLMRRTSDRGCVFLLDQRVLDPRHRVFLRELPLGLATGFASTEENETRAHFVRGESSHVLREALAHMDMLADVSRRGLDLHFGDERLDPVPEVRALSTPRPAPELPPRADVHPGDLPF